MLGRWGIIVIANVTRAPVFFKFKTFDAEKMSWKDYFLISLF